MWWRVRVAAQTCDKVLKKLIYLPWYARIVERPLLLFSPMNGAGTMKRLRTMACIPTKAVWRPCFAVLLLSVSACAEGEAGPVVLGPVREAGQVVSEGPSGDITEAQQFFLNRVFPALDANCSSCHEGAAASGTPWFSGSLAQGDTQSLIDAVGASGEHLVNLDDPSSSPLLQKGRHTGPALSGDDAQQMLAWIRREVREGAAHSAPDLSYASNAGRLRVGANGAPRWNTFGFGHRWPGLAVQVLTARDAGVFAIRSLRIRNNGETRICFEHPVIEYLSGTRGPSSEVRAYAGQTGCVAPGRARELGEALLVDLPDDREARIVFGRLAS